MKISAISNMDYSTGSKRVLFAQNNPINAKENDSNEVRDNSGLSKNAKAGIVIGAGIIALAGVGIYLATRGKVKGKNIPAGVSEGNLIGGEEAKVEADRIFRRVSGLNSKFPDTKQPEMIGKELYEKMLAAGTNPEEINFASGRFVYSAKSRVRAYYRKNKMLAVMKFDEDGKFSCYCLNDEYGRSIEYLDSAGEYVTYKYDGDVTEEKEYFQGFLKRYEKLTKNTKHGTEKRVYEMSPDGTIKYVQFNSLKRNYSFSFSQGELYTFHMGKNKLVDGKYKPKEILDGSFYGGTVKTAVHTRYENNGKLLFSSYDSAKNG